ncbi:hypothetical protein ACFVH6_22060 [Spirillospora sp. NPDC127200]
MIEFLRRRPPAPHPDTLAADRVRGLHHPVRCRCTPCLAQYHQGLDADVCGHCTSLRSPGSRECGVIWPCPTWRALTGEEP